MQNEIFVEVNPRNLNIEKLYAETIASFKTPLGYRFRFSVLDVDYQTFKERLNGYDYSFIAFAKNEPLGMVHLNIRNRGKIRVGDFICWCVFPNGRNLGVGRMLFDALIKKAKTLNIAYLQTDTPASSHFNVRRLEQCGFIGVKVVKFKSTHYLSFVGRLYLQRRKWPKAFYYIRYNISLFINKLIYRLC